MAVWAFVGAGLLVRGVDARLPDPEKQARRVGMSPNAARTSITSGSRG